MNPIRLAKSAARVFYYEGINGLAVRLKARMSRRPEDISSDSTATDPIKHHLDWSSFVLLNGAPTAKPVSMNSDDSKRSLLMLIPEPERGSGGRMTMARVLRYLHERGMECYVAFYPEVSDERFAQCAADWLDEFSFDPDSCRVLRPEEARERSYDIAMATYWPGAYVVKNCISAASKGYLVQDFEPYFHAPGSLSAFAEETYRLGLWGVCASPWLAETLSTNYGMKTSGFLLGLEKDEYYLEQNVKREDNLVVAYIRQHTERRGYELLMWALKELKDRMPGVRVEIFGDARLPEKFLWIDKNHGVLGHDELRALYNKASVGLVTSFTNYSLIPNEMIACGCAVVDLDTPCMRTAFPPGVVSLVNPTPQNLAQAAQSLMTDHDMRAAQVQKGLDYITKISWEESLASIYSAICQFSQGTEY